MAAYRRVDDLRSPAGWLPVHRDQLRAQRSVSSMGSLYLYLGPKTDTHLIIPKTVEGLAYLGTAVSGCSLSETVYCKGCRNKNLFEPSNTKLCIGCLSAVRICPWRDSILRSETARSGMLRLGYWPWQFGLVVTLSGNDVSHIGEATQISSPLLT